MRLLPVNRFVILISLISALVLAGLVYFQLVVKNSEKTYISPLGFSFKIYPSKTKKIEESSYDIDRLKDLTSNFKDGEGIDVRLLETSKTTKESFGTDLRTMSSAYAAGPITLLVAKINKIGTIPTEITNKVKSNICGESLFGILSCEEYIKEVTSLVKRRINFRDAVFFRGFNGEGQNKRYSPEYFSTPNFYGFTNFAAGGFGYPLALSKEYYLFDKNDKYFFHLYLTLKCKEKDQLDVYKVPFDSKKYEKTLFSISKECEKTAKDKADFDLLLNSLKLVD